MSDNLEFSLVPAVKEHHHSDGPPADMSQQAAADWRAANNIRVEFIYRYEPEVKMTIPNPVYTFEQGFGAYPEIWEKIRKQNFSRPSAIQACAWPVLMGGLDFVGIAPRGTGKTLAFLLPALIHIVRQPVPIHERVGPDVLVLTPTKELALQIEKEVNKYKLHTINAVCIYDGGQINAVEKGVPIVIATPGRLYELLKSKKVKLETISYTVLDEADIMTLNMGLQIHQCFQYIGECQTVMMSPVWVQQAQRLARLYMDDPIVKAEDNGPVCSLQHQPAV